MKPTVLDIGQCGFDHSGIRSLLESLGAEVKRCHTHAEGIKLLKSGPLKLVLVNRIFDQSGEQGLAFIKEARKIAPTAQFLLVSNFPEAQTEAQRIGALPGFGKAQLGTAATTALLQGYLKNSDT